ncbi:putative bifunctional diguanylate cyclase/phosphodiesterase [Ectobacillus ponti]|uniref:EAL domain-containing protein n=1 Tax=Ectobacillus ponti TaxID=2961894 RepID=A0AA41X4W1_9BACI|nr:EAL domain-containing protein [Ectobacillus ponti]MCP8968984.1 EAL domain-containing protein [Ectobacillus ponti]
MTNTTGMRRSVLLLSVLTVYLIVYFGIVYGVGQESWLRAYGLKYWYAAADMAAVFSLFGTYRRAQGNSQTFWLYAGVGSLLYLLGDLVWIFHFSTPGWSGKATMASDLFYICFAGCCIFAYTSGLTRGYSSIQKRLLYCDVAISATVVVTLDYVLVIQPILRQEEFNAAVQFVQVLYLTEDIWLVTISISLLIRSRVWLTKKIMYILAVAFGIYALTDVSYEYLTIAGSSIPADRAGGFYQVALLLIALAGALSPAVMEQRVQASETRVSQRLQRMTSVGGLLILGVATILYYEKSPIFVAALLLELALIILRQRLLRKEIEVLSQNLRLLNHDLEERIADRTKELEESKQEFESLYTYHPDAILTVDTEGNWIDTNHAGRYLFGKRDGKQFVQEVSPDDEKKIRHAFRVAIQEGSSTALEIQSTYRGDGRLRILNLTFVPIITNGRITGVYNIVRDVTEEREAERRIKYLAYRDTLTDLLNRSSFMLQLKQAIERAEQTGEHFALLFLDLNQFKHVNDTWGHSTGDLVLIEVAQRLQRLAAPSTVLSRLGGDEFLCLIQGSPSGEELAAFVADIASAIKEPIKISHHTLQITTSIGIACYPEAGKDAVTLLQHADLAMYDSKEGTKEYAFYTKELGAKVKRKRRLEAELDEAVRSGAIFVVYQPQVDMRTGRVIGFEALVRWNHPELGFISPAEFILIAEETNKILLLEECVFRTAGRQMKQWADAGYTDLKMGVNLSAKQFKSLDMTEQLTSILKEVGLESCSHYIDVELTERIAMGNEEQTLHTLRRLKEHQFHISIDDFGTGYSSLSYLTRFPVDTLKIPREFISLIAEGEEGQGIVATMIGLARVMNMSVIAEGVETKEQAEFLIGNGCYHAQGYYYSKPLSAEESTAFLLHANGCI